MWKISGADKVKSSEVTIKSATMALAGPMVVISGAQVKSNP